MRKKCKRRNDRSDKMQILKERNVRRKRTTDSRDDKAKRKKKKKEGEVSSNVQWKRREA